MSDDKTPEEKFKAIAGSLGYDVRKQGAEEPGLDITYAEPVDEDDSYKAQYAINLEVLVVVNSLGATIHSPSGRALFNTNDEQVVQELIEHVESRI